MQLRGKAYSPGRYNVKGNFSYPQSLDSAVNREYANNPAYFRNQLLASAVQSEISDQLEYPKDIGEPHRSKDDRAEAR
jgi:hypothetical protein